MSDVEGFFTIAYFGIGKGVYLRVSEQLREANAELWCLQVHGMPPAQMREGGVSRGVLSESVKKEAHAKSWGL